MYYRYNDAPVILNEARGYLSLSGTRHAYLISNQSLRPFYELRTSQVKVGTRQTIQTKLFDEQGKSLDVVVEPISQRTGEVSTFTPFEEPVGEYQALSIEERQVIVDEDILERRTVYKPVKKFKPVKPIVVGDVVDVYSPSMPHTQVVLESLSDYGISVKAVLPDYIDKPKDQHYWWLAWSDSLVVKR